MFDSIKILGIKMGLTSSFIVLPLIFAILYTFLEPALVIFILGNSMVPTDLGLLVAIVSAISILTAVFSLVINEAYAAQYLSGVGIFELYIYRYVWNTPAYQINPSGVLVTLIISLASVFFVGTLVKELKKRI